MSVEELDKTVRAFYEGRGDMVCTSGKSLDVFTPHEYQIFEYQRQDQSIAFRHLHITSWPHILAFWWLPIRLAAVLPGSYTAPHNRHETASNAFYITP